MDMNSPILLEGGVTQKFTRADRAPTLFSAAHFRHFALKISQSLRGAAIALKAFFAQLRSSRAA